MSPQHEPRASFLARPGDNRLRNDFPDIEDEARAAYRSFLDSRPSSGDHSQRETEDSETEQFGKTVERIYARAEFVLQKVGGMEILFRELQPRAGEIDPTRGPISNMIEMGPDAMADARILTAEIMSLVQDDLLRAGRSDAAVRSEN